MMLMERVAIPAAADMRGLGHGERLLIWSWRRIVAGRPDCPAMAQEFADACGEDGAEVFVTFCTFLQALGFASRKRLAFGAPGSLARILSDHMPWDAVFALTGAFMLPGILMTLVVREPEVVGTPPRNLRQIRSKAILRPARTPPVDATTRPTSMAW